MWSLRSEDRLKEWKSFRSSLDDLPFDEAVVKTLSLWSFAPFVNDYLDTIDPSKWPTPWELVEGDRYDDLSKALGMLYTLFLTKHGEDHSFAIAKAKDTESSSPQEYNLVVIDNGKYILNFLFNEVISIDQLINTSVVKIYSDSDLRLKNY